MKLHATTDFQKTDEEVLFIRVRGVGHWDNQIHENRQDGTNSFQWRYCTQGEGELHINGMIYTIRENQGMFIYPHVPFEYYATKEPWEMSWVILEGDEMFQNFLKYIGLSRSEVLSFNETETMVSLITKIHSIASSESTYKKVECSSLAYEMLTNLYKHGHISNDPYRVNNGHKQKHLEKLKPVIDYIDSNFFKVITIEDLANILDVTPQHLCLLFKNAMGLRPIEYVNKIKINRAKDIMLNNPQMHIKQVAALVGFDNIGHFYLVFKNLEQCNPGTFRKVYHNHFANTGK